MSWYCLQLKGAQEFAAENHLLAQGYDVYLPRAYKSEKRSKDAQTANKKLKVEPLFPCYCFINLIEGEHDFYAVKNTRGVVNFSNRQLIKIPTSIIDGLRSREDEQQCHVVAMDSWQKGDKVRIKTGPFKFYQAIVQCKKDERIVILLDEAKRVKLDIDPLEIEAL